MGYAFTFAFIRILRLTPSPATYVRSQSPRRLPIGAYVHYPTISTDMLRRVRNRESGVTNDSGVASSTWRTTVKLTCVLYHYYYIVYIVSYNFLISLGTVQVLSIIRLCVFIIPRMCRHHCREWHVDQKSH